MNDPQISVVMSVFNAGRFLHEAVISILDQSFTDFEFIIINDGSTDESAAILEEYSRKDTRIILRHQSNKGLVDSLNSGCKLARGTYIARMDADDIAIRDRLAIQLGYMEMHPEVGVLGGSVEFIDASSKMRHAQKKSSFMNHSDVKHALLDRNVIWHPTVLIRKAVLESVGGYRKVPDAEDYDLWLRVAEQSQLVNAADVVLRYRLHASQGSIVRCRQQSLAALAAQTSAILRRRGETDPLNSVREIGPTLLFYMGVDQSTMQTAIARGYLTWARTMYQVREYSLALKLVQTLHSPDLALTASWTIAQAYLWEAGVYVHQRKYIQSLLSITRGIMAHPIIIGRPIKLALNQLSMSLQVIIVLCQSWCSKFRSA
jgi:GT2 family glycosyltransferase